MRVKCEHGVLYKSEDEWTKSWIMLSVTEADAIAHANGFLCAERLVKEFQGKIMEIDEDNRIRTIEEDFLP